MFWSVADSPPKMVQLLNLRREKQVYKYRTTADSRDYKTLYRFSEANVEWLSQYFLGESEQRRGDALTPKQRIQIFLRYMADPGFQSGIAEETNVHQTKPRLWVKFPSSAQEIAEAKAQWQRRFKFPTCIGGLDCTHVRIPKQLNMATNI